MSEDICYFSNSTEGEGWLANWCYRCTHDHDYHPGGKEQTPCMHMCNLYLGEYDPVFIKSNDDPRAVVDRWTCIEFTRCSCDRGPDDPEPPKPPPPDPNQLTLFDITKIAAGVPADIWHDTFTKEPA